METFIKQASAHLSASRRPGFACRPGGLQLIRNAELRDSLVRCFDQMQRLEWIAERNNRDLIDNVNVPFLMRVGISVRSLSIEPVGTLNRASALLSASLGTDIEYPEDRVLSQPPDSDSWNDIRQNLLFRLRIAMVGQSLAEDVVAETDRIAPAVAAERDGG